MGRKLSPTRRALLDDLLPEIGINADILAPGKLQPADLFSGPVSAIWLEIGFGKGEHLIAQAEAHPNIGFIGCEPFVNGVATLLAEVEQRKIDNIRVYADDARDVLTSLPANCIDRVFLLHPDPWPKARHANRRFVNSDNLGSIARIMKPDGELRISTDHPIYAAWVFQEVHRHGEFYWRAEQRTDWAERPQDWPETRYGEKALAGNPVYLRFEL